MLDPSINGISLTKSYYKEFLPTDMQWEITEIDSNFTLYDLFRLAYIANTMMPGITCGLGITCFHKFWEQINLLPDSNVNNEIEYLELYWSIYYTTIKKNSEARYDCYSNPLCASLPNLMSVRGVSGNKDERSNKIFCATEFMPLNNIGHLPIRIKPEVFMHPPYVCNQQDFSRTNFKLTIDPTLFCLITSVFHHITFAGPTPEIIAKNNKRLLDGFKK